MGQRLQVVWFKRDLRLADHAALCAAAARGPVLGLVVYEPSLWDLPDASGRHAGFYAEALEDLLSQAESIGLSMLVVKAEMVDVLEALRHVSPTDGFDLSSHEETGNWASFERDKAVARWCRTHGVGWTELPQNNVVRRLQDRDQWARHWDSRMAQPIQSVPVEEIGQKPVPSALREKLAQQCPHALAFRTDARLLLRPWLDKAKTDDCPGRQRAGRAQAQERLRSFLDGRGLHYRSHMSSPGTSETSCSRLSADLAWGVLSIREVVQAVWAARVQWQAELKSPGRVHPDAKAMLLSLKSFESRLHWRCHFIQKLESEPQMELRCLHPATRGLRNEGVLSDEESRRLAAWQEGRTGYGFVDACMRYLRHNGWINFRMRAMLTSFASQHLWLHWRQTGEHLARLYTDYEPGIHWPQIQMQSGTTGINTIRIYNPLKQAADQDPTGAFVARWAPEYSAVMTAPPEPIVDHLEAAKAARDRLWSLRKDQLAKAQARQIYDKHGSRNPHREGRPRRSIKSAGASKAPRVNSRGENETTDSGDFQLEMFDA
jgi:deoxyribodipyrimidine photo-lyase